MNSRKRIIGVVMLSMLLLLSLAAPAVARDRRSSDRRSSGRRDRSHRSHHYDRRNSGLRIGIGCSSRFYSSSYRSWVPGYYQTRIEQILVEPGHYQWQTHQIQIEPAHYEIRSIPAVEKTVRDEQGNEHTIIVQPARTETVYIPPKYEQRRSKVWIPDRYETRTTQVWVAGYWISQPTYYSSPGQFSLNIGGVFRF